MKVRRDSGFSLTELVVAMAVAMILMAVSMPYFLRAYHSYQLSNAATQMADILRLTRYEAIRQNRPVICVIQPDSSDPTMTDAFMTDTSGNQMTGVNARTILLGSAGNLVSAGSVPGAGALPAAAQLGGTTPASVSPSGGTVRFDARGAVSTGNVNAFYLNSSVAPDAGYRVVLLMPAGSLQIWTGDSTGNWHQLR
jgi:prepilin-type N-terminal cleavage/methylation domain-containing protein